MNRASQSLAGQTVSSLTVTGGLTADSIAGSDTSLDITGLAGTVGTGTTAGTVGGAVISTSGNGGAKTGTGAAAGGAGGQAGQVAGNGGNTASAGTDAGGRGGDAPSTGGTGGNATAGTGNGGAGGDIPLTPGNGGTSAGGTAGIAGFIYARGPFASKQGAPVAMTTSATITTAAIVGGLITGNQGAAGTATYTMPAGTVVGPLLPATFVTNDSFDFSVINISTNIAEIITVAGAAGMTLVGSGVIPANSAGISYATGLFRVRMTGANAFSFYRIG